jgi:large conductance mechanosensitive channel
MEKVVLNEFKKFALRGNVMDLAIAVILGGAFGKIVSSFVADIMMPPIGLLLGKVDFSNLYLSLSGQHFASLEEAKKAGAPTLNIGIFMNQVIDFLIVAFAIFIVVNLLGKLKKAEEVAAPATQECPFCLSQIPVGAKRCAHCTSELRQ